MPATYEKIATTTLGSASATITFSSIAASWTDLRLVIVGTQTTSGADVKLTFNNDTATNYSSTCIYGTGTAAASTRTSSKAYITSNFHNLYSSQPNLLTYDIFSYAGSTNKTCLSNGSYDLNGSGGVDAFVGLWRSTAAITRIDLNCGSTFAAGLTATLYGILKA